MATYEERRREWTPEYAGYHDAVVSACVELMGEECRLFFERECTFDVEFSEGRDPHEVASDQQDCL